MAAGGNQTGLILLCITIALVCLVPSTLFGQDERELPPIIVEPDGPLAASDFSSDDNLFAPMGLFDQTFGQNDGFGENTGVFRGAENSFDMPAFEYRYQGIGELHAASPSATLRSRRQCMTAAAE